MANDNAIEKPVQPAAESHHSESIFQAAYDHLPSFKTVATVVADTVCPPLLLVDSGNRAVAKEVLKGVGNEIVHHPVKLLGEAAVGVGVGVVAAALAPEVAIGAAVAAGAYSAYELVKAAPGIIHDAKIVSHHAPASQHEMDAAKQHMQTIGAETADMAAGMAGAASSGMVKNAVRAGFEALERQMCAWDGFPSGYNGNYKWNPWRSENYRQH